VNINDDVQIKSQVILSDNWRVLKKTTFALRRRDGSWQTLDRETYHRTDGAAILLYDLDRRKVLLTRQFRLAPFVNGYDQRLIEVPAGLLDGAAAATRIIQEAEEEVGYCIHHVTKLFDVYMSPETITAQVHFFIGKYTPDDKRSEGGGNSREGEDIEVLELEFDEAMLMIANGEIKDGKTILLLLYASLHLF